MQCPVDNTTLVMADRSGVEIDYCGVFPKKWRHGFHAASSLMCLYPSSYSCDVK